MKRFIFFTHFCDCFVKTALIYRSNFSVDSCNRVQIGTTVYRQFSTVFHLELTSGQRTRDSKDWGSVFCEFHFVPSILWTIITDRIPLFLNKDQKWRRLAPTLLANGETIWAFDSQSILLSLNPHEMSLNIDMKIVLLMKLSDVSINLNSKRMTFWLSCNVLNPWKIFHSNSIELLDHSNLCSHTMFDRGFSFIFTEHNRIWKCEDLCVQEIDDVFIIN